MESDSELNGSLFDYSIKCLEFSLDLGLLRFPLQKQNGVTSDTMKKAALFLEECFALRHFTQSLISSEEKLE